jgi:two-component system chemotaxis response regulator CheB
VVIGASAGGIEALQRLVCSLPSDLPAAVLVVLHTSGRSRSAMPQILERAGNLPASNPEDWTPIQDGHIYIAPPDRHMLVQGNMLRVLQGPRENLHRPAIDPLFRSAAVARGRRVIGIILTGMLDDGTSGLMVVHAHGGTAMVQDPDSALFSSMPQNALDQVPEALVLPLDEIAGELVRLVREELPETKVPNESGSVEEKETQFLELEMPQMEDADRPGRPSPFACPDCGGVLWELDENGFLRFRCRVGHAFTARYLDAEQRQAIETALWSALRALEESASLYHRLADRTDLTRTPGAKGPYEERAVNTSQNAKILREFLVQVNEGVRE